MKKKERAETKGNEISCFAFGFAPAFDRAVVPFGTGLDAGLKPTRKPRRSASLCGVVAPILLVEGGPNREITDSASWSRLRGLNYGQAGVVE